LISLIYIRDWMFDWLFVPWMSIVEVLCNASRPQTCVLA